MRKGGGHDKGAGFERDMCRYLSRWLSNGARDDLLWRSASSGGRFTQNVKKGSTSGSNQAGDLTAVDPLGSKLVEMFAIECKCVADLHLQDLPYDRRSNIEAFWLQTCKAAVSANKLPLLIAKQNRRPILMGLSITTYYNLVEALGNTIGFPHAVKSFRLGLVLFDFELALRVFKPEHIEMLYVRRRGEGGNVL